MIEYQSSIGNRLKKKRNFDQLSNQKREELEQIVAKIKGLMWQHIIANEIANCKMEGEEVGILISFGEEKFDLYMDNTFVGNINLRLYKDEKWIFYTQYIPYMNSILSQERLRLCTEFSESPNLIKIILL